MAVLKMTTVFPMLACCNECTEHKIGSNRKYCIHSTNHGGNCNDPHESLAKTGIKRAKQLYGLGKSMEDSNL